jgi:hypothetical protein
MQASRLTAIAGWLVSGATGGRAGKRLARTPILSAQAQNLEAGSCAAALSG